MSKFVPLSDKPGMNALNTDFTQPGAGLQQAGVTIQNLHDKWGALYKDRGNKAGGSKQLWENLSRWTTANGAKFAARYPDQAALFNKSIQTGTIQPGLSTKTLSAALDWGIRENDRSQQHKSNFLDSTWGQILGKIAQVGVSFIPGVGQMAAIGIGAALGAAQAAAQTRTGFGDIALGAASGGLSGYGGSQIAQGVSAAGGVGNYAGNLVDKAGNFIQHPIQSITGIGAGGAATGAAGAATTGAGMLGGGGFAPTVPAATGNLWNAGAPAAGVLGGAAAPAAGALTGGAAAAGGLTAGKAAVAGGLLGGAAAISQSSKSKAPATPDLIGLAQQQATSDLELAKYNTQANRINEFNPFGSRTFTRDGDTWTSTTKLSPAEQKIYNQQAAAAQTSGALSNNLLTRAKSMLSKPYDQSGLPARQINAGQTAQDAILSRLEPQFARDEESLRSRMINQGITTGSNAANAELETFNQGRTDARLQAALQGMDFGQRERAAAFGEDTYLRNEPINMAGALRSGVQLQQPNYTNPGQQPLTQGADLLGAAQGQFQNQLGNYNAKQAQSNNTMNGLFGIGAAALPYFLSDARLKSNIVQIGEHHGHNVYEYDIFGHRECGVLAQEIRESRPDAVIERNGYLMVNYWIL